MLEKELIARWRKAKLPRLYWKRRNRRWRWDSDVIARTENMLFKNYQALVEFLEYCEALNERR